MIVAGTTQEAQTTVPETFADVEAPIEVKTETNQFDHIINTHVVA